MCRYHSLSSQVLIFENLFIFQPYIEEITKLLLRLLQDGSIEVGVYISSDFCVELVCTLKVRELAAATISDLVRCKFIHFVDQLQVCC